MFMMLLLLENSMVLVDVVPTSIARMSGSFELGIVDIFNLDTLEYTLFLLRDVKKLLNIQKMLLESVYIDNSAYISLL